MPAKYTFNDIERAVEKAGFVFLRSDGSHNMYTCPQTALSVCLPKHQSGISSGVAEETLNQVVLNARLMDINIGSHKMKLSGNVNSYIVDRQAKVKKNPIKLFSDKDIKLHKLETVEDAKKHYCEIRKCANAKQQYLIGKNLSEQQNTPLG